MKKSPVSSKSLGKATRNGAKIVSSLITLPIIRFLPTITSELAPPATSSESPGFVPPSSQSKKYTSRRGLPSYDRRIEGFLKPRETETLKGMCVFSLYYLRSC